MSAANPYAECIDETRQVLVGRAKAYRALVMAVAFWILLVAAAGATWPPMLGLAGLLPCFVSVYAANDLRMVGQWRSRVLAHWRDGTLRLMLFASTLRQTPLMPCGTIEGMLECMPEWPDALEKSVRAPLVQAQTSLGQLAVQRLLSRSTVLALIGLAVVGWSTGLGQFALVVVAVAGVFIAAWPIWSRRQVDAAVQSALQSWPPRDENMATQALQDGINRQGVPSGLWARWQAGTRVVPAPGRDPFG